MLALPLCKGPEVGVEPIAPGPEPVPAPAPAPAPDSLEAAASSMVLLERYSQVVVLGRLRRLRSLSLLMSATLAAVWDLIVWLGFEDYKRNIVTAGQKS